MNSESQEKNNRQGLLTNITGAGKGKTTSALGSALRALGRGWKVTIIQFIKDDRPTGEKLFFQNTTLPVEFLSMGVGFSWEASITPEEHIKAVAEAWKIACHYLKDEATELLILDELNVALHLKWLQVSDILPSICSRPVRQHVIITGRNAPEELIAASDMVSEIKEIKHPFQLGIKAQPGVEY